MPFSSRGRISLGKPADGDDDDGGGGGGGGVELGDDGIEAAGELGRMTCRPRP